MDRLKLLGLSIELSNLSIRISDAMKEDVYNNHDNSKERCVYIEIYPKTLDADGIIEFFSRIVDPSLMTNEEFDIYIPMRDFAKIRASNHIRCQYYNYDCSMRIYVGDGNMINIYPREFGSPMMKTEVGEYHKWEEILKEFFFE